MKVLSSFVVGVLLLIAGGCGRFDANENSAPQIEFIEPSSVEPVPGTLSGSFKLRVRVTDDRSIHFIRIQLRGNPLDSSSDRELFDWTYWAKRTPTDPHEVGGAKELVYGREILIDTTLTLPPGIVLTRGVPASSDGRYEIDVAVSDGNRMRSESLTYTEKP